MKPLNKESNEVPKILSLIIKNNHIMSTVSRSKYSILIIISFSASLLPFLSTLFFKKIIDSVSANEMMLSRYICIYFIILILIALNNAWNNFVSPLFSQLASMQLSKDILNVANKMDLLDFENSDSQNKIKRALNFSSSVPVSFFLSFLTTISTLFSFLLSIAYIWSWNPVISIVYCLFPMFCLYNYFKIANIKYDLSRKQTEDNKMIWYLQYILTQSSNFKENKITKFGEVLLAKFIKLNQKLYGENYKMNYSLIKYSIGLELINIVLYGLAFIILIVNLKTGLIIISQFIVINQLLIRCYQNSKTLTQNLNSLIQNVPYIEEILDVLDWGGSLEVNPEKMTIDEVETIEFKNVFFKYKNASTYTIKNMSFKVSKGSLIQILGNNGAGKTTLVKLISGLYEPTHGCIYINGIERKNILLDSYFKTISVLFQDYAKFELSIEENIFLKEDISFEESKQAHLLLQKFTLKEKFLNFEEGIKTRLGFWFSDSQNVSGGEWQKIAIIRSITRPFSVLVMDEGNANLDTQSRYEFSETLLKNKDKIVFLISHNTDDRIKPDCKIML